MLRHLKYSIPDFLLCLLASVGLGINVVQSFLLPAALSANVPRLALVSAVTILILILLSYSRITAILGGVLGGAAMVALIVLTVLGCIPGFAETPDPEANGNLWYLIVVLCAIAVYLLCRTRATSWVLLALGTILSAYFLLLEYTYYVWGLALLLWSVGTWLCFLTYRKKILRVSAQRTAFLPVLGYAAGLSTLCLLIGCLLWWGVVRPLQPPTRDIVLQNEVLQSDAMQVIGVYQPTMEYLPDAYTDNVNDDADSGEQEEKPEADTPEEVQGTQDEEHSEDEETQTDQKLDAAQQEGAARHITYDGLSLLEKVLLTLAIVLLLLVALLILFFRRRQIWYKRKTRGMDDGAYIRFFFPWYLRKLTRVLKLPAPRGNTPLEYAAQVETSTRFLNDTGVTWQELSRIYTRTMYSGRPPEPEDRGKFEQFYRGFHRCCRRKLRLSWLWKSLRL